MQKKHWLGWFLFGLGSQLQLWGTSLCFSELFIVVASPFLLANELQYLRRNGLMTFFILSLAVVAGGGISCIANGSPMFAVIRGMAVVCLLPCTIIVSHWMLRKNPNGFKWWLIGAMISGFLCTFFFQRAVEVVQMAGGVADENSSEAIMSGPIYWIGRLGPLINLPAKAWYFQCPTIYCVGAPLFMAGFAMLTSTSGRAAALCSLSSAVLVLLGGKKQRTMKRVGRYFWIIFVMAIVGAFVAKSVYRYAALNDWLSEEARQKYEQQTKGKTGMMALLLGGRMESFCGLIACVDKPILGFGPWALDHGGYTAKFLSKFADEEDVRLYYKNMLKNPSSIGMIPCHSYITEFWLWYGIFGLLFWLYVIFVFVRYLKQDSWAIPQWYMWITAAIPGFCWGIFFSPWANRVGGILFVVACLFARAVRRNKINLPFSMIREISIHQV